LRFLPTTCTALGLPLKPVVQRLNVHSFGVVPIRARGAVIGTLDLGATFYFTLESGSS
jgi:hypothetical protein